MYPCYRDAYIKQENGQGANTHWAECLAEINAEPLTFFLSSPQRKNLSQMVFHGQVLALRAHCVCTACMLRTQRLRYSPKNTCHLSSSTVGRQSPHENNETAFKLGNQLSL